MWHVEYIGCFSLGIAIKGHSAQKYYILTNQKCDVEPVSSTVSLGFNVDNNEIGGEFMVSSYQEFKSASQNYKILGIELEK